MNTEILTDSEMREIRWHLTRCTPEQIIVWAYTSFGECLVMTSSFGIRSAATLHLVTSSISSLTRERCRVPIIFIDTGYLEPERIEYMKCLKQLLDLNVLTYRSRTSPDRMEERRGKLWEMGEKGIRLYNMMRKIIPCRRALREHGAAACIAGLGSGQTEYRARLREIERRPNGICDIYPILRWSDEDVRKYMAEHHLPPHPLAATHGSVGDWHSTRPGSGREGRVVQECGLHTTGRGLEDAHK